MACAAEALLGTQLLGMDLSQSMVQAATQRFGAKAEFCRGDTEKMPLDAARFDAVTCNLSIHHYPHPQATVDEMYRKLSPFTFLCVAVKFLYKGTAART